MYVCVTIVYVHAFGFMGVEAYICISRVYMCEGEYVYVSIVCIYACGYGLLLRLLATSSRIFSSHTNSDVHDVPGNNVMTAPWMQFKQAKIGGSCHTRIHQIP